LDATAPNCWQAPSIARPKDGQADERGSLDFPAAVVLLIQNHGQRHFDAIAMTERPLR
jgi:hypothetical protein